MEKMRQWSILTGVAVVAVLALGWFLVVSPQHSRESNLHTQAAAVESQNSSLVTQVSQLQQQQKNLPAEEKLVNKINTQIPNNPALPALIRQLSAAASGAGVDLVSLAPATPTMVTATATSAKAATPTAGGTSAAVASPLAQIPVTIQVQGSYFNIESFFAALESLSRATMANSFAIVSAGTGTSAGTSAGGKALPPGALTASIQALVYMSPDVAVAVPTTPTQAK